MIIIDKIQDFIKNKEDKEIYQYSIIYVVIIIAILAGLIYWHYTSTKRASRRLKNTNKERIITQELLSEYKILQQQEEQLDSILKRTRDFKIHAAYLELVDKYNLADKATASEPTSQPIPNTKYSEIILKIDVNDISTQKLVEILDSIEKYERLYVKEVEVSTQPKTKTIDVHIVIATLGIISP